MPVDAERAADGMSQGGIREFDRDQDAVDEVVGGPRGDWYSRRRRRADQAAVDPDALGVEVSQQGLEEVTRWTGRRRRRPRERTRRLRVA